METERRRKKVLVCLPRLALTAPPAPRPSPAQYSEELNGGRVWSVGLIAVSLGLFVVSGFG